MWRSLLILSASSVFCAADNALFDAFVKRCESSSWWSVEARTLVQDGEPAVTRVFFAAPDKLRVEEVGGKKPLVVLNGATGWYYQPEDKTCFVLEEPDALKQLQKGDLALGSMAAPGLFKQMTMRTDARPVEELFEGMKSTRLEFRFGELDLKLWLRSRDEGPVLCGSEMSSRPNDVTKAGWSRRQVYTNWNFEKQRKELFVFEPPADVKVVDALTRREHVRVAPILLPKSEGKLKRDFEARQTAWMQRLLTEAFAKRHTGQPWLQEAVAALREAAPFLNEGGTRNEMTGVTTRPAPGLIQRFQALRDRGCDDPLFVYVSVFLEAFLKNARLEQVRMVEALWPRLLAGDDPEAVKAFVTAWLWNTTYAGASTTRNSELKKRCDDELVVRIVSALESAGDREDAFGLCQMLQGEWPLANFCHWRRDRLFIPLEKCRGPKWVTGSLLGEMEITEAWEKRGGGWASTVTDEGWKGFEHWLTKAREHLSQAWEEEKEAHWAATRMITVTMAGHGVPGVDERTWFDRATAACFDHIDAYDHLLWAWRPRWGGSHELMLEFGKACAATRRYDTIVPSRLFKAVRDVSEELACKDTVHEDPELCRLVLETQKGMVARAAPDEERYLRSFLVVNAFLARDYATAAEALARITDGLHSQASTRFYLYGKYPVLWQGMLALHSLDKTAFATFEKAEQAYASLELESARKLYQQVLKTPGVEASKEAALLLRMRLAAIAVEKRLQTGQWVKLAENERRLLWIGTQNDWWNHEGGHLSLKNETEGAWAKVVLNARVGLDFEVRGRLDNPEGLHHAQLGIMMGLRWNYNGWASAVAGYTCVKPNRKGAALVSQSYAATEDSPHGDVELKRNSTFHLRVKDGEAVLTIDGAEVVRGDVRGLYENRRPWQEDSPEQNMLGFGCNFLPKGESWIKDIEIRRVVD